MWSHQRPVELLFLFLSSQNWVSIGAFFSGSGLLQLHRMTGISGSCSTFLALTLLVLSGIFFVLFFLSGSMDCTKDYLTLLLET